MKNKFEKISQYSSPNTHHSSGISLIALIVTIITIIILATLTITMSNNALNSMSEAKFKAELRGLMDRLKIYHENASLESFTYRNNNLFWDGVEYYAENTGKVENGEIEDTAEYILGNIPAYFYGKIDIKNGRINVDTTKFSEEELEWIAELGLTTSEFYEYADLKFDGDPENIINTGICLFNEENIDKDFEIRITVTSIGENLNNNTILNAKYENGTSNPGIVFRYSSSTSLSLGITQDFTNGVQKNNTLTPSQILNKEIIISRKDGKIYHKVGDSEEVESPIKITSTFDTPLTIGCSLTSNGKAHRCFVGEVSYVSVTIFNSSQNSIDTSVQKYERYNLVCDNTHYFNSNICLYNSENINKDFEIKFKIKSLSKNGKNSTIINSMNEADPWPGFVFRYDGDTDMLDIRSVRTSLSTRIDPANIIGKEVTIYRQSGKLYYKIEGSDPVNVKYKAVEHNTPVTFGASLEPNNAAPQRFAIVTFDYIKLEVFD